MLVYIVSHRGPYAEKAWNQQFWLTASEANEKREELNQINAPAVYSVYQMLLEPLA